jgi:hypothetical protein
MLLVLGMGKDEKNVVEAIILLSLPHPLRANNREMRYICRQNLENGADDFVFDCCFYGI